MLLALSDRGGSLSLRAGNGDGIRSVGLNLIGAATRAPEGVNRLAGQSNYFIGSDKTKWRAGIPHFGMVRYRDVYPGIDWVYYGNKDGELEYDFIVNAGADPSDIRLRIEHARKISVTPSGDLAIDLGNGTILQRAPVAYQESAGGRIMIAAQYELHGSEARFRIAEYDRSQPLIIDPVLTYFRYVGGSALDVSSAVAVDASGNAWIAAETNSLAQLATPGAPLASFGGGINDGFVSKISPAGTILFSTYFGGSSDEFATGIAIDAAGAAFVTGSTNSPNLPLVNAFRNAPAGESDAFVARFDGTTGAILLSSYLGGNAQDVGNSIATDGTSAYIAGGTNSTNWPLTNGTLAGGFDAYVAKVTGSTLIWVRFVGGTGHETSNAIAVRGTNVWTAGQTTSFTVPSFQPAASAGGTDAFAALFNTSGVFVAAARLGGTAADNAAAVAIDSGGNVWVGGDTRSANFPVQGAWMASPGGARDGFLSSVNAAGNITYSTFIGGSQDDIVTGVAIDPASGIVYIGGTTLSTNLTFTDSLSTRGLQDAFVIALRPAGNQVEYSTAIGGTGEDLATGIAADGSGGVYLTGYTTSPGITGAGGTLTGGQDGFIARIQHGTGTPDVVSLTPLSGSGTSVTATAVYRHPGGQASHYLGYLLFLPLPNVVSFNAQGTCLIEFNRLGGNFDGRGGVRLIDNAGTDWLGRLVGEPARPGTPPLSNNACTVNVAGVTVSFSGTDMTVTVPITFHNPAALSQTMGTFIQSNSTTGQWTDFRQFGNWMVPGAPMRPGPQILSGTPTTGIGASANFAFTAGHTAGLSKLGEMHIRFAPSIIGSTPCHIIYSPAVNVMAMINDAGTALIGPVPIGQPLTTNRCSVPAGASRFTSGNNVTLNLPVNFNAAAFGAGLKNVYVNGFDINGAVTHWVQTGTWTVQ